MVKTQRFHCCGPSSISGQENKIPQATWCCQKKKNYYAPNLSQKVFPRGLWPILPDLSVPQFSAARKWEACCNDLPSFSPLTFTPPGPSLTMVFLSAFWTKYPVISLLPSSLGGCHSTSALVPHTSFTITFCGGPAFSGGWVGC